MIFTIILTILMIKEQKIGGIYQNVDAVGADESDDESGDQTESQTGVQEGQGHRQDASAQTALQEVNQRVGITRKRVEFSI